MEVEEVAQNGLKNDNESSSKEKLLPGRLNSKFEIKQTVFFVYIVGEKRKRTRTSTMEKRTSSQALAVVETRQKSKRPKRNAASPFVFVFGDQTQFNILLIALINWMLS